MAPGSSDRPFYAGMLGLALGYAVLVAGLMLANIVFLVQHGGSFGAVMAGLARPEIQYAAKLSLVSATIAALLALWVGVAIGYLMARHNFPGKAWADALLDLPLVLPPMVIGLSLLLLFQLEPLRTADHWLERRFGLGFTYGVPGVILAQFTVACAFAARAMRAAFAAQDERCENVALTLGCTRSQAFWRVALPEARHGLVVAFTLAWARSFGEFGPILVFAGATRFHTEVLPTTIYLEATTGNLEAAAAVSLLMAAMAAAVLAAVRLAGGPGLQSPGGTP